MSSKNKQKRAGFTLSEMMVAVTIFSMMAGGILMVVQTAMLQMKGGNFQSELLGLSREAQSKITYYIYRSRIFSIQGNSRLLLYPPGATSPDILEFDDADGDPATLADNRIIYTPDGGATLEICRYVSQVEGPTNKLPFFQPINLTPRAVRVALHMGDNLDLSENTYATGPGYQGVELRFSVTPRNVQQWYD